MRDIATSIASNPYLQAASIAVALVTAIIFLWTSRRAAINVLGSTLFFLIGKIWVPSEVSYRQLRIAIKHRNYFNAVIYRHMIVLFGCALAWTFIGNMLASVRLLKPETTFTWWTIVIFEISRNIFSLIIGARMGEIMFLCKRMMQAYEIAEAPAAAAENI